MKVTVNNNTEKQQEIKFPCLMQQKANKEIIALMLGQREGKYNGISLNDRVYPITEPTFEYTVGYWKPFKGSITLSNE